MLTDAKIRALRPAADGKARRVWDARGLYLEVRPSGAKVWRFKFRLGGKERVEALGTFPEVSLAAARVRLQASRHLVAAGTDPLAERRAAQVAGVTFAAVKAEWIETHGASWAANTRALTEARLRTYADPVIGAMPIADVTRADIIRVLKPLEKARKGVTARRLVGRIRAVFHYAMQTGRAEADPTVGLKGAVAVAKVKHRAALLEPRAVGELLRAIDGYAGGPVVRAALRLLPHTLTRPGELCGAEWREIDLERAVWSIPAARMKMRSDHIVPLSRAVLALLAELRLTTGAGRHVFPNARDAARPMTEGALIRAMKAIGYGGDRHTPHGWRATSRTLIHEQLKGDWRVIEKQLAHRVPGALGATYDRTEFLAERRTMMEEWSMYLATIKASNVVAFPAPRRA